MARGVESVAESIITRFAGALCVSVRLFETNVGINTLKEQFQRKGASEMRMKFEAMIW